MRSSPRFRRKNTDASSRERVHETGDRQTVSRGCWVLPKDVGRHISARRKHLKFLRSSNKWLFCLLPRAFLSDPQHSCNEAIERRLPFLKEAQPSLRAAPPRPVFRHMPVNSHIHVWKMELSTRVLLCESTTESASSPPTSLFPLPSSRERPRGRKTLDRVLPVAVFFSFPLHVLPLNRRRRALTCMRPQASDRSTSACLCVRRSCPRCDSLRNRLRQTRPGRKPRGLL